jgi:hypothetical protein
VDRADRSAATPRKASLRGDSPRPSCRRVSDWQPTPPAVDARRGHHPRPFISRLSRAYLRCRMLRRRGLTPATAGEQLGRAAKYGMISCPSSSARSPPSWALSDAGTVVSDAPDLPDVDRCAVPRPPSGVRVHFCTPSWSTNLYAFLVLAHKMREGDIVVTRVAHHYALGRVNADLGTQTPVDTQDHRADALRSACVLAGDHRVFLYELAGPSAPCIRITCCDSDQ